MITILKMPALGLKKSDVACVSIVMKNLAKNTLTAHNNNKLSSHHNNVSFRLQVSMSIDARRVL